MTAEKRYGPVHESPGGAPWREVYVPIGGPQPADAYSIVIDGIAYGHFGDLPEGAECWQAYEVTREYLPPYEEHVLEPAEEMFGE